MSLLFEVIGYSLCLLLRMFLPLLSYARCTCPHSFNSGKRQSQCDEFVFWIFRPLWSRWSECWHKYGCDCSRRAQSGQHDESFRPGGSVIANVQQSDRNGESHFNFNIGEPERSDTMCNRRRQAAAPPCSDGYRWKRPGDDERCVVDGVVGRVAGFCFGSHPRHGCSSRTAHRLVGQFVIAPAFRDGVHGIRWSDWN